MSPEEFDRLLEIAKRRTVEHLPTIRDRFNKGWPTDSHIYLTAKFETKDGGYEDLGILVQEWDGDIIRGKVNGWPKAVEGLDWGTPVNVNMNQVSRWMIAHGKGWEADEIESLYARKKLQELPPIVPPSRLSIRLRKAGRVHGRMVARVRRIVRLLDSPMSRQITATILVIVFHTLSWSCALFRSGRPKRLRSK